MIPKKVVDRYAHQSGARDQLVAEREVVLTYALEAMVRTHAADHVAFKGGTCLRKMVFGSNGRFSEDLDFTLRGECDSTSKFRAEVSDLERLVLDDAGKGAHNGPLAERLRAEIRSLFADT